MGKLVALTLVGLLFVVGSRPASALFGDSAEIEACLSELGFRAEQEAQAGGVRKKAYKTVEFDGKTYYVVNGKAVPKEAVDKGGWESGQEGYIALRGQLIEALAKKGYAVPEQNWGDVFKEEGNFRKLCALRRLAFEQEDFDVIRIRDQILSVATVGKIKSGLLASEKARRAGMKVQNIFGDDVAKAQTPQRIMLQPAGIVFLVPPELEVKIIDIALQTGNTLQVPVALGEKRAPVDLGASGEEPSAPSGGGSAGGSGGGYSMDDCIARCRGDAACASHCQ